MPVTEMLNTLSANELLEWRAYYTLYPFPIDRADINASRIQAMIANTNRSKSSDKIHQYTDYMPNYGKQVLTQEELLSKFARARRDLEKGKK